MDTFTQYNNLWSQSKLSKPLVILIGGYIGTGKSTFAKILESKLDNITVLPTGIIRSVSQAFTTENTSPELFVHTYDLDQISFDLKYTLQENLLFGFNKQRATIDLVIQKLINFTETEGQQYILDGNHILPSTVNKLKENENIISLFFYCQDKNKYRNFISSPTHRRIVSEKQINNIFILHDLLATEVRKFNLPLFEYYEMDKALQYVNSCINDIITSI